MSRYFNVFDIGQEILDSVQNAVNSGDFSGLNRDIRNTINGAGGSRHWTVDTGRSGKSTRQSSGGRQAKSRDARGEWRDAGTVRQPPAPYVTSAPGRVSGIVMEAVGFPLAAIFGIVAMGSAGFLFTPGLLLAGEILVSIFGALALTGLGVGLKGFFLRGRARRFRRYVERLKGRGYCSFEELSRAVGKKKDYVIRDVRRMIDRRFFLEAHIDEQQTCLMLTDEVYDQYRQAQESMRRRQEQEESVRREQERREANPDLNAEGRKVLKEGYAYIRHIHQCNDDIPGEEISRKLSRLEMIMTRIFDQVEKQPELAEDLHKFMNYYLPTTAKLVEAYRELDAQPVEGENIRKTKQEIEDTLDTINEAFEKLLDSFFEDKAWDISSDINVMKTMLKQEGLTGRDFAKE
jgi:hypothetical protein